jgi:polyphosphate kinase 2 (PPK2 family)
VTAVGRLDALDLSLRLAHEEEQVRLKAGGRRLVQLRLHLAGLLTDDDWRNRERRAEYLDAVEEMVERTDSAAAPWRLVEADSKPYARVKMMETTISAVEEGLRERGRVPPPPP